MNKTACAAILALTLIFVQGAYAEELSPVAVYKGTAITASGGENYDAPLIGGQGVVPGPYPYTFELAQDGWVIIEIRHMITSSYPSTDMNNDNNHLSLKVDTRNILNKKPTHDFQTDLVNAGPLKAGVHGITMDFARDDGIKKYPDEDSGYAVDYIKVWEK